MKAIVLGAGLAGCEAAWQLARRGIDVELIEMKPLRRQSAHQTDGLAELVCSNSLRSNAVDNASGLLKQEMRRLGSLILEAADATALPAGGALAVDRAAFSAHVAGRLASLSNLTITHREATAIPDGPCVVATGPLTDGAMAEAIAALCGGDELNFYDAVAPIVTRESVDMDKAFAQSRWGEGDGYLNCPLTEEEYNAFYDELIAARTAELHEQDRDFKVFEGCMPVEVMARRGRQTLTFGPMKPIGLTDPHTGRRPYAVVQLRQDNREGTHYNLVGFQTQLAWPEQRRVLRMVPGLEHAEFVRYGVMHRNTYLNSPNLLTRDFALRSRPDLFFAGQMTGVEGYVESAASGFVAGIALGRLLRGKSALNFCRRTVLGALGYYVADPPLPGHAFAPMNATFGILEPLEGRVRGGRARRAAMADRSLDYVELLADQID